MFLGAPFSDGRGLAQQPLRKEQHEKEKIGLGRRVVESNRQPNEGKQKLWPARASR